MGATKNSVCEVINCANRQFKTPFSRIFVVAADRDQNQQRELWLNLMSGSGQVENTSYRKNCIEFLQKATKKVADEKKKRAAVNQKFDSI